MAREATSLCGYEYHGSSNRMRTSSRIVEVPVAVVLDFISSCLLCSHHHFPEYVTYFTIAIS